jgi:hypothetical protein
MEPRCFDLNDTNPRSEQIPTQLTLSKVTTIDILLSNVNFLWR